MCTHVYKHAHTYTGRHWESFLDYTFFNQYRTFLSLFWTNYHIANVWQTKLQPIEIIPCHLQNILFSRFRIVIPLKSSVIECILIAPRDGETEFSTRLIDFLVTQNAQHNQENDFDSLYQGDRKTTFRCCSQFTNCSYQWFFSHQQQTRDNPSTQRKSSIWDYSAIDFVLLN